MKLKNKSIWLLLVSLSLTPHVRGKEVVVLTYSGPIGTLSTDYIERGASEAEARGAAAIVLQLDTPGGMDTSMRRTI